MTGEIKTAFDCIRAEDSLKAVTTQFLYREIQKRHQKRSRTALRRYAAAFACAAILLLSGAFAYNTYTTPVAYVDVDVNPSVELVLNSFDRVIDAHAYNDDGINILEDISIKHKSYGDALSIVIDAITGKGYLSSGGLVSVTLQTDDKNREGKLLSSIQTDIADYMAGHHHTAQVDVFPVSVEVRNESHELGVTPAKYLAIQELIEVDPTASVESCRRHSISEIKELTQAHGRHHGSAASTPDTGDTGDVPDNNAGIADNGYVDDTGIYDDNYNGGHDGNYNGGNSHHQNTDTREEIEVAPSPDQRGGRHGEGGQRSRHGGGHNS